MSQENIAKKLLAITREFLAETGSHRAIKAVDLSAKLERDLGIDSLGKVELQHRIEKNFQIQLNESSLAATESLQDLLQAVIQAKPTAEIISSTYTEKLSESDIDVSKFETLTDVLKQYAIYEPERPHIYLQDENGKEETITYGDLYDAATSIAHGLIHRGIKPLDTVAIMVPTSRAFFYSFFGILFAGAIPVPIYPPFRPDRIEEYIKREAIILQNAEIKMLITFSRAEILANMLKGFIPSLITVTTADALKISTGVLPATTITEKNPALIQYTSGSTGNPKGVLLLHKQVLANIRAIGKTLNILPTDSALSWLPLYHDMGLMSWLSSLYFGIPITILSPLTFLSRPERWLWAIHYHRATLSAGPNFAYELCVKKIDAETIAGLDLSSWRLAFNGAEAVNADTLKRFSKKYKSYGFKEEALFPVYGLAENTVALAFPQKQTGLRTDKISRSDFENKQLATQIQNNDEDFFEFVCCGEAIHDHEIRVVNDEGEILPERHIGNLQFRGPSALQEYYRNPSATQKIYHDGWWDTGDLAYLVNGEVYITGRKKDLIIKAGRNIYPEAIETIVNQISGIRKGCVVAFGISDAKMGTEKLIVVAETHTKNQVELDRIEANITEQMSIDLGITADEIIFVEAKIIPKTSSGKLQRAACKQAYLARQLTKKRKSFYWQITKLFLVSSYHRIKNFSFLGLKFIYSIFVWLVLGISVLPTWILALALSANHTEKLVRFWAKSVLKLSGCRLKIINAHHLVKMKPMIFVANHSSYSDALIVLAILPEGTLFIVKKELNKNIVFRTFIKKLNYLLVNRFDFSQNITDTKLISDKLQQKKSILIFPEGTFSHVSGLRPFKTGAFQLAVETQTAICPIAIAGTRTMLRTGKFLITPTKLTVTVSEPILPEKSDWQEVNRLRILARNEIAKYCGEPLLDIVSTAPITKE